MTTLFHFASVVNSETFGNGIGGEFHGPRPEYRDLPYAPSDKPRTAGRTTLDAAWWSGFTARYESSFGEDIRPPADLGTDEVEAWVEGSEWAIEQMEADMSAAWDMDSPENDEAEAEEHYLDTLAICGGRD